MKPVPLRLTDGVLFIDNSSLSLINECMRKASYALGYRRKQARDETALRFGGIMHKVLETRYRQGTVCNSSIENAMIDTARSEFQLWQPPEGDFRNLDQAVACLTKYNKTYPTESFEIIEVAGHRGTETPFAVPFGELEIQKELCVQDVNPEIDPEPKMKFIDTLPVVFTGRIDLVIQDANGIWLMDHKTSSIGGSNLFAPFYIDSQFKGYAWALKQLLGQDSYPSGVLINALINRRPTRTGKSIEFLRDTITFTKDVIEEWHTSFMTTLQLYLACIEVQQFPMQTPACVSKYGRCEFYDVCQLPLAQRDLMLNSGNYVDRTWDPITQDNQQAEKKVFMP